MYDKKLFYVILGCTLFSMPIRHMLDLYMSPLYSFILVMLVGGASAGIIYMMLQKYCGK